MIFLSNVDIYDGTSRQWAIATLSRARDNLAASSWGDVTIFAGGSDNSTNAIATVDIFNVTGPEWTTTTLSQARAYLVAASLGDVVLFAGGASVSGFIKTETATGSNTVDIVNFFSPLQISVPLYIAPINVHSITSSFCQTSPMANLTSPGSDTLSPVSQNSLSDSLSLGAGVGLASGGVASSVYHVSNSSEGSGQSGNYSVTYTYLSNLSICGKTSPIPCSNAKSTPRAFLLAPSNGTSVSILAKAQVPTTTA